MGSSPIAVLSIITLVLVFEGLLFGEEVAAYSFPTFEEPQSGGFFGVLEALLAIVQAIWGTVVFLFNLLTFNIPGAPWYVRVPVGGMMFGALVWSIAELIRGK